MTNLRNTKNSLYYALHCSLVYLSIDSALDGPAIYRYVGLFVLEFVTLCDADHLLHQIQPCDTLSDGVLHLRETDTLTNILK